MKQTMEEDIANAIMQLEEVKKTKIQELKKKAMET